MNFIPRYSLLTLLLLTAFIAAGVKLWHGPHRVVDRPSPQREIEFTYTRDWRGNQIVHGPVVQRRFEGEKLVFFAVSYCRRGIDLPWVYGCYVQKHANPYLPNNRTQETCPLTAEERLVFQQTRDDELLRVATAGIRIEGQYEGVVNYITPTGGGIGLGR